MDRINEKIYDQFLDSLESIKHQIGKHDATEIRTNLIEIQLEILSNIDTIGYEKTIFVLEKVKTISILLSSKS